MSKTKSILRYLMLYSVIRVGYVPYLQTRFQGKTLNKIGRVHVKDEE